MSFGQTGNASAGVEEPETNPRIGGGISRKKEKKGSP